MSNYVFISLQDENKISIFTLDDESSKLALTVDVPVSGAPSGRILAPPGLRLESL